MKKVIPEQVIITCDRCGETDLEKFKSRTNLVQTCNDMNMFGEVVRMNRIQQMDLCDTCSKLFYNFINEKKMEGFEQS